MKKFSKILSMVLVLTVFFTSMAFGAMAENVSAANVVTGQNLLTNPGFETGDTTGWGFYDQYYTYNVVNEGAAEGEYCAKITNRTVHSSDYRQLTAVESGKTYLISGKVKQESGSAQPFIMYTIGDCNFPENTGNAAEYVWAASGEWTQLIEAVVPNQGTTEITPTVMFWGEAPDFMVDDHFLGELVPVITYTGETKITVPDSGSTSYALTASIKNQLGTDDGLKNETIARWELVGNPYGVSVSGNQLTVAADAEAENIQIEAVMNPSYAGAPAEIRERVTISLHNFNMINNPGFETGDTSSWGCDPNYLHFTMVEGDAAEGNYSVSINREHGAYYYEQKQYIEAGKTYLLSAKVKHTNGNAWPFRFEPGNACTYPQEHSDTTGMRYTYVEPNVWTQLVEVVVPGEEATAITPSLMYYGIEVDYMVDDHFMAELKPVIKYTGETEVAVPDSGSTSYALTASIKNQLGTDDGLKNEDIDSWALVGTPTGVSISGDQLIVASDVEAENIQIKAVMKPSYAGAPSEITKTFTVSLVKSEITYNQQTLTSGILTPHVTWINNTGVDTDIRVYSVLYKKSGSSLVVEDVVVGDAVTVGADLTYDSDVNALTIPELGEDDYIVKTYVWTTSLVPVFTVPGSLD